MIHEVSHAANQSFTAKTETFDDQMMDAMRVPVQAGDTKGAKARFENVREKLNNLTPEEAGAMLDRFNAKDKNDPLAKEFHYRFHPASIDKMMNDLRVKSGREGEIQSPAPKSSTRTDTDKNAKKAEGDIQAQSKRSSLDGSLKISQDADELNKATSGFGTDEKKIFDILSKLNSKTSGPLQVAFEKKFGVGLETRLRQNLEGADLEKALDMLYGKPKPQKTIKDQIRDMR